MQNIIKKSRRQFQAEKGAFKLGKATKVNPAQQSQSGPIVANEPEKASKCFNWQLKHHNKN